MNRLVGLGLFITLGVAHAAPLVPPRVSPVILRPAPTIVVPPGHLGPVAPLKPVPMPTPVKPTGIPIPPPHGGPVVVPTQPVAPVTPTPTPAPVTPTITIRDATRRMNAMRAFAPKTAAPTQPKAVANGYSQVKFSMTIPDNLGHAPTSKDVTVNAGLDGLTPQQALAKVWQNASTVVAPQNNSFVSQTILDTHKAFTIGVNNAFTTGSPSNQFITTQLKGAQVTILGTMSAVHPTVIMAKLPTDAVSRFYVAADSGGGFTELPSLPYSVLMKAKLQNGVQGGIRVNYTTWGSKVLSGPTATITELGSATTPATGTAGGSSTAFDPPLTGN